MRMLVTGATGFIGHHLTMTLLQQGHQVYCLARTGAKAQSLREAGAKIIVDDLLSPSHVAPYLSSIDVVFHVAGVVKGATRNDYFDGNLETTKNLITLINTWSPPQQKLVYISSQAAAGPSCDPSFGENDHIAKPVSSYGQSKLAAEKEVLSLPLERFVTILRPSIVYGPGDIALLPFFKLARRGLLIRPGILEMPVNFIYVKDLVRAILLAAEKGEANRKTFFTNDGTMCSWRMWNRSLAAAVNPLAISLPVAKRLLWVGCHVGQVVTRLTGITTFLNTDKWQEIKQSGWLCSAKKIRKELGFFPLWRLDRGILETVAWYYESGWMTK